MLPYKIIKENATHGLRFEEACFALERALQDDTPASCFLEVYCRKQESKNGAKLPWKKHEDDLLEEAIKKYGPRKWSQIAKMVPGKTTKQCCDRWRVHVKGTIGRNAWNRNEDAALEKAVCEMGQNWTLVAKAITGKTNKQCRDRFKNYVNPALNKSPYTEAEDAFIMASANSGHGWANISDSLDGRTDAHVKLRFHQLSRASKASKTTKASKKESAALKPEECHKDYSCVLNTNDFLDEDALQSFIVQWEQPKLRNNNKTFTFTPRVVKKIKHSNCNFMSTTLKPFGSVHANNFHNFQKINKRIRGKVIGKEVCTRIVGKEVCTDLLCHEIGGM